MKNNLSKTLLTIFIVTVVIIGLAYVATNFVFNKTEPTPTTNINNSNQPLIGGQTDEHGCLIPAGYSWCEAKQKCLRIWEEECPSPVADEIKQALAKKYNKDLAEVKVTVVEQTESHARGSVQFAMNGEFGEGGLFLAAKFDNQWKIVFDGNGEISCQLVEPYGFPEEMISDCAE